MRLIILPVVAALSGAGMAFGQSAGRFSIGIDGGKYTYTVSDNIIASNVPLNEISARAFRHFSRHYSFAVSEKWIKVPHGEVVSFVQDSKNYQVFYSKKGYFLYSFTYYPGANCSAELTKTIAGIYPGFQIINATELYDGNKTTYGITITNGEVNRSLEYRGERIKILAEYNTQR